RRGYNVALVVNGDFHRLPLLGGMSAPDAVVVFLEILDLAKAVGFRSALCFTFGKAVGTLQRRRIPVLALGKGQRCGKDQSRHRRECYLHLHLQMRLDANTRCALLFHGRSIARRGVRERTQTRWGATSRSGVGAISVGTSWARKPRSVPCSSLCEPERGTFLVGSRCRYLSRRRE